MPASTLGGIIRGPESITGGPDGNLWFTLPNQVLGPQSAIGRITPAGVVTQFPIPGGFL